MPKKLGVYISGDVNRLWDYEKKLGRQVDIVRGANWYTNRNQMVGVEWLIDIAKRVAPREMQICLVPFYQDTNYVKAARGEYDDEHREVARKLAGLPGNGPIRISIGYEVQGTWFPWSIRGDHANFKAFQERTIPIYRAASSRFVICLNSAEFNNSETDMRHCVPGVTFRDGKFSGKPMVDQIGCNFYVKRSFQGQTPAAIWNAWKTSKHGLDSQLKLARDLGLPFVIPELGLMSYNNENSTGPENWDPTPFIRDYLAPWCRDNVDDFILIWDGKSKSSEGYLSNFLDGGMPRLAAAFKASLPVMLADRDGSVVTPTPSPEPPPVPDTPAAALLRTINAEAYAQRDKLSGDAATLIRWVEDVAYWATKGAATAPAGKETDPLKALLAIYDRLTEAPTLPEPGESLIAGWVEQASPILDAAGLLEPPPEPEEPGEDVAALRAEVAALRAQLAAEVAARQAVEGRLAVIRAALG